MPRTDLELTAFEYAAEAEKLAAQSGERMLREAINACIDVTLPAAAAASIHAVHKSRISDFEAGLRGLAAADDLFVAAASFSVGGRSLRTTLLEANALCDGEPTAEVEAAEALAHRALAEFEHWLKMHRGEVWERYDTVSRETTAAMIADGGYTAIVANAALSEKWQDVTDAVIGYRFVDVRNALRERGWVGGHNASVLTKNVENGQWSMALEPHGNGYNHFRADYLVRWTAKDLDSVTPMIRLPDRLTMHPAEFAEFIERHASLLFGHYDAAVRTRYVIVGEHELERYGTGFWNREAGWTTLDEATRYVAAEVVATELPESDGEARWWPEDAAAELAAEHESGLTSPTP